MKKIWLIVIIAILVIVICFFGLICKKMVYIDGNLYRNTGKELAGDFVAEEGIVITSSVRPWEKPAENGQSNFGKVGKACVPFEGGLAVDLGEWVHFELYEPLSSQGSDTQPAAEPSYEFSSPEEAVEHIRAAKASEAKNEGSSNYIPIYERDCIYFLKESPLSGFTQGAVMLVYEGTVIIYNTEDYKEKAVFTWNSGDETDEKVKERISRFNLKRYLDTKFFFGELHGDIYIFWWENGDEFDYRYPADSNIAPQDVIEYLEVEKFDI